MGQPAALIRCFPYRSAPRLGQGGFFFPQNPPPADTSLVATRAMLLVRDDLHPALVAVLAQAVLSVQSRPTLKPTGESRLFAVGTDALTDDPAFPMSDDARPGYESRATLVQRALPFWLATLFDRAF